MNRDNLSRHQDYQEVRRVLLAVLVANLAITLLKIGLGIATGALAVMADGFHSLVDSSSNLIGLAAVRLASRPADSRHPYGYRRYETLGALAIGGLLIAAAWEISRTVFERIIEGTQPELDWLTFSLVLLTFPVNLGVVIYETRAGNRLNSEILLADATHTRTDLFVTASVIASLVGVWLGWGWLDLVVALGVVALILKASIGILRDAAGSLADVVGVEPQTVEAIALQVPGVLYVHNVRSRGTSDAIFVDLHVKVDPVMATSQAHAVASEVERRICEEIPHVVDAIVHIEPAQSEVSGTWRLIANGMRQIADGMGLGFHDLHIHVNSEGEYTIELDLEIHGETHKLADEFEDRLKAFWPPATRVITHLEPIADTLYYPSDVQNPDLKQKIAEMMESHPDIQGVLEIQISDYGPHRGIMARLVMSSTIHLTQAHATLEEIKRLLHREFPDFTRVVLHVEPAVGEV